jgi:hypothetical protein
LGAGAVVGSAAGAPGWLVCVAVIGGLAGWEAVRVAEARATVAGGWGAGIAAGVGGGLVLAVLFVVTVLVQRRRRRPWGRGGPLLVLVITAALLLLIAVLTSTPPRPIGPDPAPYVVTSGIAVAEIAYVSTCLALLAVLAAASLPAALVRERRRGRMPQGARHRHEAAPLRASVDRPGTGDGRPGTRRARSVRDDYEVDLWLAGSGQAMGPLPSQPRRLKSASRIAIATTSEPMPRKRK